MSKDLTKDLTKDETDQRPADATMVLQAVDLGMTLNEGRASLIVLSGWEIGREIVLGCGSHILGRSAANEAFINAPSVSRQHAKIDFIADGADEHYVIVDLGSSNGTILNNAPIKEGRLRNGDRIRLGDVLLKFVSQDDAESSFHKEVHRRIHYDQLTGLLTMEAFRQRLDSAIREGSAETPFTLAMTDLDGLKRVNDTHGHLAGRMVVREMGVMMRQALRPLDIAGLYGGDEAIVLFPATPLTEASAVAEALRHTIETRVFEHHGQGFGVTISQGLAEWPRHAGSAEELIAAADRALYQAKAQGRNRVCMT